MALVRDRILKAFGDNYGVMVVTDDNKLFYFYDAGDADAPYLGCAHSTQAACAWMRGFAAGRGLPIPGASSDPRIVIN